MQIGPDTPAIITGGASGLGAATARRLAAQGAPVALLDLNAAEGEALARDLGGRFIRTDVTDPASVAAALGALSAPPRLCICCAGIASAGRSVDRHGAPHDPEAFVRTIAINLTGSFNTATQAAAAMAKTDPLGPDGERGNIVLTASIAAFEGQVGQIAYAASKGGVAAMALPMARDLTALGIRVNAMAPGLFRTPMVAGLPEDVQSALGAAIPYPSRLGDPDEFAALVETLITNPMLNGSTIRLDGAFRMPPK